MIYASLDITVCVSARAHKDMHKQHIYFYISEAPKLILLDVNKR